MQGGLTDEFLNNELGIDPEELHAELLDAMGELNKLTHVREGTIVADEGAVLDLVQNTMLAVIGLFENAETCRSRIELELAEHIDREVMDKLISETIDDLDIPSTHTTVEGHQAESIAVRNIGYDTIEYRVLGTVFVQLQYGSDFWTLKTISALGCRRFYR